MQAVQPYQLYCLNSWDKTREILRTLAQIDTNTLRLDNRIVEIQVIASDLLSLVSMVVAINEQEEMKSVISYLDLEASNAFLKKLQNTTLDQKDVTVDVVLHQLRLLYASFSIPEGIQEYSRDEMRSIFSQPEVDYDYVRFVYTLNVVVDSLGSGDFSERVSMVKDFVFIEQSAKEEQFTWEDLLVYALMLRIVWRFINYLSPEELVNLFSHYIYKSIVLGLPVRQYLEMYFNDSTTFPEYLDKLNSILSMMERSVEECLVYKSAEGKRETLPSVITMYNSRFNKQSPEAFEKEEFLNSLYINGIAGRDRYIHWLRETLYIYSSAESAQLGQHPDYRKRFELTPYEQEMSQLIDWFLDEENWYKILSYYTESNHKISIQKLIQQCSLIFDLKKEKAVQRFLDFTALLQQNNILKPEEFIIEFHEEDGQFHWNENLLA